MNLIVSDNKGGQNIYNIILKIFDNIKVTVMKKIE